MDKMLPLKVTRLPILVSEFRLTAYSYHGATRGFLHAKMEDNHVLWSLSPISIYCLF